ncbi:glycosyltransferase family 4 protein [Winogradskyella luteola]|uniref:Glycosyltransferase family 4 protein n=1 Tax=Winogradskyella luteola TaxID=2828330 RepID=A0A9X1F804_9FLAO|nr:glycosyltransferase family 4 protein [Winogradskyella luteola]MBV7268143.1 glycosyltransferase family 4 protein [Winogradskyella luteola]
MSHKKNIGFVVGTLSSGGAERVISTLSNSLIERFDVTIITFSKSTPFYTLDNRVKVVHCRENIEKPKSALDSLKLNYSLTKRISKISKQEGVDILIGFITSANILTVLAAKLNGIPSIISERNNPLVEDVPKLWEILRKFVYPKADSLVLQTKGIKKLYEKKIRPNKITILPNPISSDLSKLRNVDTKQEKIILSVGRLDKNKCHDELITAFHTINPKDWKAKIIGDGNKKQELTKLIKQYNLSDRIEIISKVKDIDRYYNEASIFVFTSKTEGFPNALLEAMHFGLPCISTDCNFGPSDLIKDGKNGFLIPVNDQQALTAKLSQLINGEELQTKFSHNAKQTTEAYTSEKVVAQWEALINKHIK